MPSSVTVISRCLPDEGHVVYLKKPGDGSYSTGVIVSSKNSEKVLAVVRKTIDENLSEDCTVVLRTFNESGKLDSVYEYYIDAKTGKAARRTHKEPGRVTPYVQQIAAKKPKAKTPKAKPTAKPAKAQAKKPKAKTPKAKPQAKVQAAPKPKAQAKAPAKAKAKAKAKASGRRVSGYALFIQSKKVAASVGAPLWNALSDAQKETWNVKARASKPVAAKPKAQAKKPKAKAQAKVQASKPAPKAKAKAKPAKRVSKAKAQAKVQAPKAQAAKPPKAKAKAKAKAKSQAKAAPKSQAKAPKAKAPKAKASKPPKATKAKSQAKKPKGKGKVQAKGKESKAAYIARRAPELKQYGLEQAKVLAAAEWVKANA